MSEELIDKIRVVQDLIKEAGLSERFLIETDYYRTRILLVRRKDGVINVLSVKLEVNEKEFLEMSNEDIMAIVDPLSLGVVKKNIEENRSGRYGKAKCPSILDIGKEELK